MILHKIMDGTLGAVWTVTSMLGFLEDIHSHNVDSLARAKMTLGLCTKCSDDLHNNRPHLRAMIPLRFTYVPYAE